MSAVRTRRWRQRRRSRGAALVEAVIVVPVLAILMAMMVFMWRVYSMKIAATALGREQIWTYAQSTNCGTSGDPSKGYSDPSVSGSLSMVGGGGLPNLAGGVGPAGKYAPAAGGGDEFSKDIDVAAVSVPPVGIAAGAFGGGDSAQVGAKLNLTCNEPPYDGNLINVGKEALRDVKDWKLW
jgi:hypothetical protein